MKKYAQFNKHSEGNELYRYVFLADGKTTGQYIHEKGVSVPIPGYEIEAETKYFLEDPAQWGSSYLKAIDD